jgi:hypothetical protein
MAEDTEVFLDDFDHYAAEVSRARHQDFARILRQWFAVLDHAPQPLRTRIAWLREHYPSNKIESEVIVINRGMRSGKLNWPDDIEERLSGQLQILDAMTEKDDAGWQFAMQFFRGGSNIDQYLSQLVEHLFEPHARELRRYLEKNSNRPLTTTASVPAADRVVELNHNSLGHQEVDAALGGLETTIIQSNQADPVTKERVLAEVGAARRLLKATTVRIGALVSLLGLALSWVASQMAETAAGKAAEWAIQKLLEYLPDLIGLL